MISKRTGLHKTQLADIVTFIILWHFFFASSFVLRLNPKVFWPIMLLTSVLTAVYNKAQISGTELEIISFSFVGLILCFFSADPWTAVNNDLYFFVYLCVAAMMARYTSGKAIRKQIMFYCIVHVVCVYLQVLLPTVYKSVVLPLLPSYVHSDILYQMTYNSSYYGFTVQTSITAMYMTFGAIVTAVNAKHEEKKSKKIIDVVFALVFVTGILFVTRRGSFLAIVLILAYIYFDTSKSKASRVLLLIVGALFLLYFGIDKIPGMQGMLDKFSRLSGNMMNGRQNIWATALNNLWKHPLFGYGVGRANVTGGGGSVDNAYIAVLVERGIIGMIVFFIPYIHTLVQTYSRRKKCGAASKSLETSFYFQLLFIIMSVMENYYGQALSMFVYFLMVFSAQFDD